MRATDSVQCFRDPCQEQESHLLYIMITLELPGGRAIGASSLPIFFGLIQHKDRSPSISAIFWYAQSLTALPSIDVHQRRVGLQAPRVGLPSTSFWHPEKDYAGVSLLTAPWA